MFQLQKKFFKRQIIQLIKISILASSSQLPINEPSSSDDDFFFDFPLKNIQQLKSLDKEIRSPEGLKQLVS